MGQGDMVFRLSLLIDLGDLKGRARVVLLLDLGLRGMVFLILELMGAEEWKEEVLMLVKV